MKKVTIGLGDENDFFERGRRIAKAADSGEVIPEEAVVTFGHPVELVRALTPSRLELVAAVKAQPIRSKGSPTAFIAIAVRFAVTCRR